MEHVFTVSHTINGVDFSCTASWKYDQSPEVTFPVEAIEATFGRGIQRKIKRKITAFKRQFDVGITRNNIVKRLEQFLHFMEYAFLFPQRGIKTFWKTVDKEVIYFQYVYYYHPDRPELIRLAKVTTTDPNVVRTLLNMENLDFISRVLNVPLHPAPACYPKIINIVDIESYHPLSLSTGYKEFPCIQNFVTLYHGAWTVSDVHVHKVDKALPQDDFKELIADTETALKVIHRVNQISGGEKGKYPKIHDAQLGTDINCTTETASIMLGHDGQVGFYIVHGKYLPIVAEAVHPFLLAASRCWEALPGLNLMYNNEPLTEDKFIPMFETELRSQLGQVESRFANLQVKVLELGISPSTIEPERKFHTVLGVLTDKTSNLLAFKLQFYCKPLPRTELDIFGKERIKYFDAIFDNEFTERRKRIEKNVPLCSQCKSDQVQLFDWTSHRDRVECKCRVCGFKFDVMEPVIPITEQPT